MSSVLDRFPVRIRFRFSPLRLFLLCLVILASIFLGIRNWWFWRSEAWVLTDRAFTFSFFSLLMLLVSQLQIDFKESFQPYARALFFISMTLLNLWIFDNINNLSIFRYTPFAFFVNYALILMIHTFFWLVFRQVRRSVPLAFSALCIFAYVYRIVYAFRGSPLFPHDFLSVGTALDVAGNYALPTVLTDYLAFVLCVIVFFLSNSLPKTVCRTWASRIAKLLCTFFALYAMFLLFSFPVLESFGLPMSTWPTNVPWMLKDNGPLAYFFMELHNLQNFPPPGYNHDALPALLESDSHPTPLLKQAPESNPHIFVIVNESFSDFSFASGIETNEDPMPFFHSLHENTVKGNLFVGVRGGSTSNSEYEFLTGNVIGPNRSTPAFDFIVKNRMPSIATFLSEQGYTTISIHPANGSNYNRYAVYDYLGFDQFFDIWNFENPKWLRDHWHIADSACYEKVIELYEQRKEDEKLFIYTLTLQNHSDYQSGKLEGSLEATSQTENRAEFTEYFRCIQQSDIEFEKLINYFNAQDEPIIVLFFGDHQPYLLYHDDAAFAQKTQTQAELYQYMVPFYIWANYDIPEKEIEELSTNYLSSLLLSYTGLDMGPYENYLLQVMEKYPVFSKFGYTDANGEYTSFNAVYTLPEELNNLLQLTYDRVNYGTDDETFAFYNTPISVDPQ